MLGSREKNLVHFRGVFAPRIDRFLGEEPFRKIEGRSQYPINRETGYSNVLGGASI